MIQKLAAHIVNQIAAGEVVDRPSSVIKELIENAIDSGASKIEVSFEEGGLKWLSVEDNGCGIAEGDLPLVFEPHATSKLKAIDDLEHLGTLGFRGEALASIQSVADCEVWSTEAGTSKGIRIFKSYGGALSQKTADVRLGTQIIVRGLFAQHQARFKFMKTLRGESQSIVQVFKRYALARPDIEWKLKDGDQVIRHLKISSPEERCLWFFDRDVHREGSGKVFLPIEGESEHWKIKGFQVRTKDIGQVKQSIQCFLAGRPIRDLKLEFALRRAYESFTDFPRKLSAVLWIEGSGEFFDVNVHPQKLEVRFLEQDELFSLIVRSSRKQLEAEHRVELRPQAPRPELQIAVEEHSAREESRSPDFRAEVQRREPEQQSIPHFTSTSRFQLCGAVDNTYLIATEGASLYLFDQHALHERIIYERLMEDYRKGRVIPSQRLLFPIPVVLENAGLLLEQEELLEKLGFEVRLWNGDKIQLVAVPAVLKKDHAEVLAEISDSLELPLEALLKNSLATVACHSAVRAHDFLSPKEAESLLADFGSKDALGHCPHGRPTFVAYQLKDLEKLFHRVL